MLKELCCTAMLLTAGANLYAQEPQSIEKSQTIVYINGAKYYVHNVRHGETLYSLAKTYGVAEQVIAAENPQLAQGLKADQSLKIPVVETGVVVQEQLSPKKLKKTFDQHTVQKGETLYGISKRYAISVETIMEDNPGLDPIHLKLGSVILIRKKAVGKTDAAENTAAWEQYKDRLNLVAEEGYMYHIVAPGETMYALSRRFGTTVENLERLNGISAQDLRSGSMLKVPGDAKSATEPAPEERFGQPEPTESDTLTTVEPQVKEVDFLALSSGEPLRVALLLPMTDGDKQNPNYLDFYQGFLLGLEKIKTQYGYSVRVDLFNTRQESDRLRTIVDDADFRAARLIVGPFYEEELPAVIGYAEEYAVPVVSPLADVKNVDSDVLFQMAPPQMRKYAKIEELTQGEHKQVTLIYGEKNDREFEREILAALQGVPYARHNYRYAVKEGDQGLSSLLANGKDNLLIVLSDSGLEVDRILAAIASANTNYQPNLGNPLPLIRQQLLKIYKEHPGLKVASVTTTGYGEELVKNAFRCDFGLVETVAHFTAAKYFMPDVDFIIDIGGQDMKCFKIEDGAISNIFLNEACSSGCGSFLQTFAQALGYDVKEFAALGLFADRPVDLGSRCTVFMNSSVKQAQKDGASIENISAGLSISVVKNALYKVIRASSPEELGRKIVVQGGTFYNEAVLRAFEKEMGVEVIRPDIAGLMGAYGAALFGLRQCRKNGQTASAMMSEEELERFDQKVVSVKCGGCGNHCQLTVNTFADGRKFISGNRCDKPVTGKSEDNSLNLYAYKQQLLAGYKPVPGKRGSIGIPLCLNMYELLPFWHAFWTKLGFAVHTSPVSSRGLYLAGQATIPSDTACFPAKLSHGHIKALTQMHLDAIFYPCLTYNIDEGLGDNHYNCPVVAYYPEVLAGNCPELEGQKFIYDYVGIHRPKDFVHKMAKEILPKYFGGISEKEVQEAANAAYAEYEAHMAQIRVKGSEIIDEARRQGRRIIVLAGRPYHVDPEVNHGIDHLITRHGAAVVTEDSISNRVEKFPTSVLNQWTYHSRLYAAAKYCTTQKDMDLVQLVSFGCGVDAITTDETREILQEGGKLYTQLKIDEITNLGAVNIRLRSLFAALDERDEDKK